MENQSVVKTLMDTLPQIGEVTYISIRPERKALPVEKDSVLASSALGLEGDHFASQYSDKRQVTLIQQEHLDAVASMLGREEIDPRMTRRNVVIKGINLHALINRKFLIGEVVLEGTGHCHPCSRMEENLGKGGYNAMRGHGGLTARITKSGVISVGDKVRLVKK